MQKFYVSIFSWILKMEQFIIMESFLLMVYMKWFVTEQKRQDLYIKF